MIINKNAENTLKYLFCLLIMMLLSSTAIAQKKPVKFNRLTSSDGLSQNTVSAIVQDHDGFIWIGTEDGINKYDGYNFEIFKRNPGDSLSLNDNQGNAMLVTRDGTLWIGGSLAGLSKYNSTTKTFTRYNNDHSDPNSLAEDVIIDFSEDERGNLWILTRNKGFDYMMVSEEKFIHMANMLPPDYKISEDRLFFIHQDKQNNLWIGAAGKIHYFKISYSENGIPKLQPVRIENQIVERAALSIEESESGVIWIGTEDGINKYDGYNFEIFKRNPGDSLSLNDNMGLAMHVAKDGTLWIGGSLRIK